MEVRDNQMPPEETCHVLLVETLEEGRQALARILQHPNSGDPSLWWIGHAFYKGKPGYVINCSGTMTSTDREQWASIAFGGRAPRQATDPLEMAHEVKVVSVRFEATQALVDFLLFPGSVSITMPVLLPPTGMASKDVLSYAYLNLAGFLQRWANIAAAENNNPDMHLQRRGNRGDERRGEW